MPELAKLPLNPDLPAGFKKCFIKPGGIASTTQLH